MRLGVDTDGLARTASVLTDAGGRIDAAVGEITAAVGAVRWTGADADRFRREWHETIRRDLGRTASSLRAAAADAARQIADQERASAATGPATTVLGVASAATALARSTIGVGAAPERVRVVTFEAAAGAGVEGWFSERVRIEHLPDGRARVTSEVGGGAGVGVGASRRIGVAIGDRDVAIGGAAEGTLGGGVRAGRTWIVSRGEVDDLLVQLAVEHADVRWGDQLRRLDRAAPVIGRVADAVGLGGMWDRVTYSPPTPERVELGLVGLADLDLSADLSAGPPGGAAGVPLTAAGLAALGGVSVASVGFHPSSGATSVRIEGEGAATALVGARGGSAEGAAAATVTFDRERRPVGVEVERTVRDGDRLTTERWSRPVGDRHGTADGWTRRTERYEVAGSGELDVGLGPGSVRVRYEDFRRER